ncbi:MAG: DUF5309 domain-containing protein [Duncaniella sp.]|nr:DUF5309 domain-containing protein [Duncaniella sp.]
MKSIHTSDNGAHLSGAPLTTLDTETLSPGLLRSEVDERITKIRPTSTPIDQISRLAGARRAGSMKVDYYSVDTKAGSSETSKAIMENTIPASGTFELYVDNGAIFSKSETVLIPSSVHTSGQFKDRPLICYVKDVNGDRLVLRPVQIPPEAEEITIPRINKGALVVRMGRAAGELDVQTDQYTALPTKEFNYCQIFKAQIEESVYQRLSDKEVGWSFSDQEEVAIIDMRLGIEKSFLFGNRCRLSVSDSSNEEVFLTGGIWYQAGKDLNYDPSAFSTDDLISMMRQAFSGGTGSTRKVLVGGSGLIEALNKLEHTKCVTNMEHQVVWGVDFTKLVSNFGTFYVAHSEIFDLCGMPDHGLILDPEYITKYSHLPFSAERISFRKQGLRNTEGIVLTEASCLVLRYPQAHARITPSSTVTP